MTEPDALPPPQLRMSMPEAQAAGAYADFVSVWHTNDTFTLDFAATTGPPFPVEDDDGQVVPVVPAQVVARVRIPPGQVFEIMKALEQQLSAWERERETKS